MKFGKLVRDKVVSRIKNDGLNVKSFEVADKDILGEVAAKITEEAVELRETVFKYLQTTNASRRAEMISEMIAEIADIEDWLYYLQCLAQISTLEVQAAKAAKTASHGRVGNNFLISADVYPACDKARRSIAEGEAAVGH